MAVTGLHHLHVMTGNSRESLAPADHGRKQHSKCEEYREQRSEAIRGDERSHQSSRSTSRALPGSSG